MKRVNKQSGVLLALLSAILVLMLMSALLVGFVAMVNADQTAGGIDRDQTQAYAAAHAGVEKLTSDLGHLLATNFQRRTAGRSMRSRDQPESRTAAGHELRASERQPGYRISFPTLGRQAHAIPIWRSATGSTITAGPYQGLVGLITPYTSRGHRRDHR